MNGHFGCFLHWMSEAIENCDSIKCSHVVLAQDMCICACVS